MTSQNNVKPLSTFGICGPLPTSQNHGMLAPNVTPDSRCGRKLSRLALDTIEALRGRDRRPWADLAARRCSGQTASERRLARMTGAGRLGTAAGETVTQEGLTLRLFVSREATRRPRRPNLVSRV